MYLSYPEGDGHAGAEGDVSTISAVPSSDDMLGVHALSIGSPGKAHIRRPLEWRYKVLARELAAKVEAHPSPEAEPAALASTPPTSNRNSGTGGKRRRPESSSGGGSPVERDGRGEHGLGRGWDGCGSAVTGMQSGQGAADACDAPNGQEL